MWSCKGKGDESSGSLSGHLNHRSSLKFNCTLCNFMWRRVDSWLQPRAGAPVFWPREDSAKWLLLRPFFPTWHITVIIVFVSSSSHICLSIQFSWPPTNTESQRLMQKLSESLTTGYFLHKSVLQIQVEVFCLGVHCCLYFTRESLLHTALH